MKKITTILTAAVILSAIASNSALAKRDVISADMDDMVVANMDHIITAQGEKTTFDLSGDGLTNIVVDQTAVERLVENKDLVKKDGNLVYITASAAKSLSGEVINNNEVSADIIQEKNGRIYLVASRKTH